MNSCCPGLIPVLSCTFRVSTPKMKHSIVFPRLAGLQFPKSSFQPFLQMCVILSSLQLCATIADKVTCQALPPAPSALLGTWCRSQACDLEAHLKCFTSFRNPHVWKQAGFVCFIKYFCDVFDLITWHFNIDIYHEMKKNKQVRSGELDIVSLNTAVNII